MRNFAISISLAACAFAAPVLMKDSFAGSALDPAWKAAKGKWEVTGGVVKGTELEADKHAAVIRRAVAYRNAVIEFDFKLAGADWVALSLNKQGGHVSRVVITPSGFRVQKDADKKTGEKAAVLAQSEAGPGSNEWRRMRVVVEGKKMTATLDGKTTISGEHAGIDVDKVDIGFPVKGKSVYLRNVSVEAR